MTDLSNSRLRTDKNQSKIDFKKAVRVIESCENIFHISGARAYINLYFNKHSKNYLSSNNFRLYKLSTKVSDMYNDLYIMLLNKEKHLEDV